MNIDFFSPARVMFGRGQCTRLGELAKSFGSACLVVYNGGEPGAVGALARVPEVLAHAGCAVTWSRQKGEPRVEDIDRHLAAARAAGCGVVIGIGGGSAIDAAKATAGLLTNGGSALDYMEVVGQGKKITQPAAPWIAVPTTAGTGAEATRNAVIGYPAKQFKASIRSEHLLPRIALVDPELGVHVPPDVTASSGMDALCQCIEAYTSTGAQPITDAVALKGIELAGRSLARAYRDGADVDAREDMAMAALLSGIALTNAGLGAVHGFAAPLGANFPVPHGTVCAALLPHVIAANVAALRATDARHATLARYAVTGRAVTGHREMSDQQAIGTLTEFTRTLLSELRIPPLGQFGLTADRAPEMASLARKASSMRYNPVVLSDEALAKVLLEGIG